MLYSLCGNAYEEHPVAFFVAEKYMFDAFGAMWYFSISFHRNHYGQVIMPTWLLGALFIFLPFVLLGAEECGI